MIRTPRTCRSAAILSLLALAACAPVGPQLIGDPQNPYPLAKPPQLGDIVHLPTGTLVTSGQMLTVAADARIVYVGETHDNPASHRLELTVLKGLAERSPGRLALGMEMFSRSQQPVLDRWVRGELSEKTFLKESRWFETWGQNFAYYRELLNFARDRQIPVIALNAEKSLVRAVRSKPLDQLSEAERAQLPVMDLTDPYQRGLVTAILGDPKSHGGMLLDGFINAQTVWDETMAESVANYLQSPAGQENRMLVVAGGNHIRNGFGIPRRVFRRLPTSYLLIGCREIDIPASKEDRMMEVNLPEFPMVPYDFVAYLAYEELAVKPLLLGVMIEPATAGGGLLVKEVVPESNAERAGLLAGDRLLSLDGEPLAENFDLVYAIQQKKPGDRGVLRVERAGESRQIEVSFLETAARTLPHVKQ